MAEKTETYIQHAPNGGEKRVGPWSTVTTKKYTRLRRSMVVSGTDARDALLAIR